MFDHKFANYSKPLQSAILNYSNYVAISMCYSKENYGCNLVLLGYIRYIDEQDYNIWIDDRLTFSMMTSTTQEANL